MQCSIVQCSVVQWCEFIRKIYIWTISNSRDNNFHHDCYELCIIISWVAIWKFMQYNIIFKTIFEYIDKKFRFVHTNTFCKYRKKLRASPRVHLVLYIESLWRCRQTFRTSLSSVEIPLERGSSRYIKPINLKIGLEIGHWVIHVWKELFLETRVASCKFMQFTIICK